VALDYATRKTGGAWTMDGRILVLLLVGAALRLAWTAQAPKDQAAIDRLPDQREYLTLGESLLQGNGLVLGDLRFEDTAVAYRMPGYPLLVAACGADVRAIRVAQSLIDTSTILAVYLLARRWLEPGPAILAPVLVALNPFLIYFCSLVLSETLFAAMLIWGMTLLVMRRQADLRPTPRWGIAWWCGAILLALSVMVRPSAIALPVVLGIAAAFVNRHWRLPYDWKWCPPVACLMILLTAVALLPWAWRNHHHPALKQWIWTTTNSGISLYDGLNPDATGASDQSFIKNMPQLRSLNEVGRSKYLGDLAWRFVREHPDRAIQLAVIKLARTWSPVPLSSEYQNKRLMVISLAYMVPLYLLVLLGLWQGEASRSIKVYLLAPAIYFSIAHMASVGSLRYRIPADLPMTVIAAMGAGALRNRPVKAPASQPE
jgi:4-amino-4-deoxy-L-arabinose transferase-like glycosyltransferase